MDSRAHGLHLNQRRKATGQVLTKTINDFELEPPPWLIEDWLPLGHKGMDTAPEGSFKTILGCWMAVCIASGNPIFGQPTYQGKVMMVDEETPKSSLEYHLERFSLGLGLRYKDLPIYVFSMQGFEFGRKTKMNKLFNLINSIDPVFIRMDSLLAMMPSGRERFSENSDIIGITVRNDLNKILEGRSILLAAHSKKFIAELSLDELIEMEMTSIVRGHSSIVGEGCDTGYILKKISEHPNPTRFCIITKVRRQAIPANRLRYIEMVEESYGHGWARLEEIPAKKLPPSEIEKELFKLFKVPDGKGNYNHSSGWIRRTCAFYTMRECRFGIVELLKRKAIVETGPQNYEANQKRGSMCDPDYLKMLDP